MSILRRVRDWFMIRVLRRCPDCGDGLETTVHYRASGREWLVCRQCSGSIIGGEDGFAAVEWVPEGDEL